MALNNDDLKNIGLVFEQKFDEMQVATKVDIKHLPTKEEYFKREDEMMGKLKKIEEELTMLSDHSSGHSDRIEVLEKIHPQGRHKVSLQI